jgi:hypothetical protein
MKTIILFLGLSICGFAFAEGAQTVCKYNEDDGTPTKLYERIALDDSDYYSPARSIQLCERAGEKGDYVLIEEELIKNFRVRNPAVTYKTGETKAGLPYFILNGSDAMTFLFSKDGAMLKVYKNGNELVDILKLVTSQ